MQTPCSSYINAGTLHITPVPNIFEFTDLEIKNGTTVKRLTQDSNGRLLHDQTVLMEPGDITVGTGLMSLANGNTGQVHLSLTGQESRSQLKLKDSQNVVRNLESDVNGNLVWAGSSISTPLGTTQANPIQNLFMVDMLTNVNALFLPRTPHMAQET